MLTTCRAETFHGSGKRGSRSVRIRKRTAFPRPSGTTARQDRLRKRTTGQRPPRAGRALAGGFGPGWHAACAPHGRGDSPGQSAYGRVQECPVFQPKADAAGPCACTLSRHTPNTRPPARGCPPILLPIHPWLCSLPVTQDLTPLCPSPIYRSDRNCISSMTRQSERPPFRPVPLTWPAAPRCGTARQSQSRIPAETTARPAS
jgi:hypothetical protein